LTSQPILSYVQVSSAPVACEIDIHLVARPFPILVSSAVLTEN
jgi:hypothetical protein